MSNSYTKGAFVLTVTDAEAAVLRLVPEAVEFINDRSLTIEDLEARFITMGPGFAAVFPRTDENPFDGLLNIFSDINCPCLDFDMHVGESDGSGRVDVTISGEQIDVETVAELIRRAAKSALPFGFEYACDCDKLRVGEFGGGYVAITEAEVEYGYTGRLLESALARTRDEGADGFVLVIRDAGHGLSFWNSDSGFGRLAAATVFSEAEAAKFDVPIADDQPEWLAMPAPLRP